MMQKLKWSAYITPYTRNRNVIKALLGHVDLIFLLVRRDFVKEFKQTILGPLWFIIQPAFQTVVLLFVFGKIGGMGPDGIPQISFFLSGVLIWNLFSENLLKSSETFRANAPLFSKVYFPRLVIPVSNLFTSYLKTLVQLLIFFITYFIEVIVYKTPDPSWTLVFFPVYLILASLAGMGTGLIISAVTTRYWDLRFLVQFGVQLLMFMSTVVTPLYKLDGKAFWMKFIISANPVSSLIEAFRYGFLGLHGGQIYFSGLIYSAFVSIFLLILGIFTFSRVERNFVDSI